MRVWHTKDVEKTKAKRRKAARDLWKTQGLPAEYKVIEPGFDEFLIVGTDALAKLLGLTEEKVKRLLVSGRGIFEYSNGNRKYKVRRFKERRLGAKKEG